MAESSRLKRRRATIREGSELVRHSNARWARQAVADGQYRKVLQRLTSAGLAQASPEVINEMLTKHPQSPSPLLPSGPTSPPLQICERDIIKALQSFPNGTAPGPSRLRANHLKEAAFCPSLTLPGSYLPCMWVWVFHLAVRLSFTLQPVYRVAPPW